MTLQLRYVTHSEIGLIRKNNQDSGYASPHLLVVADGMGGAAAGDLASAVAIDTIRKIEGPTAGEEMLDVLVGAIHQANDKIAELVESDLSLEGMGTTVTGAMFDGAQLGLAHIGDSRAYLFRGGELKQLTRDDSWVSAAWAEGILSHDEIDKHPLRNVITKAVGAKEEIELDTVEHQLVKGDVIMLCSDGLHSMINDEAILKAVTPFPATLPEATQKLIDAANEAGGKDNVSVVLLRYTE